MSRWSFQLRSALSSKHQTMLIYFWWLFLLQFRSFIRHLNNKYFLLTSDDFIIHFCCSSCASSRPTKSDFIEDFIVVGYWFLFFKKCSLLFIFLFLYQGISKNNYLKTIPYRLNTTVTRARSGPRRLAPYFPVRW